MITPIGSSATVPFCGMCDNDDEDDDDDAAVVNSKIDVLFCVASSTSSSDFIPIKRFIPLTSLSKI